MTTTYPNTPNKLIFLVALAGIVALAALGVAANPHAEVRHGSEADVIRKCLNDNGPVQIWMSRDRGTFYLLCQVEKGIFGIQAVDKSGQEKTAFVPKGGTWLKVIEYLTGFATRFTGQLPWMLP